MTHLETKIKRILATIDDVVTVAVSEVTNDLFGDIEQRVFNEGKNSNEQLIGQYSTKDLYVGAKSFYKKSVANTFFQKAKKAEKQAIKEGFDSNWITTKKGKNVYKLIGGYKELRLLQGFQVGKVDLTVSTDLKNSVQRDDSKIFFKNTYGVKVGRGNEAHFKQEIFSPSIEEREKVLKTLDDEIHKLFSND